MNDKEFILAIDIGTGATKAIAFDVDLGIFSMVRKHYPILVPQKGWSEQEPGVIWAAVLQAMREIVSSLPNGSHVLGISFSSQMYSVLAVNSQGEARSHSLTWSDTRGAKIAQEIRRLPEARQIYQNTGDPIDAIYPLTKILWLQRNCVLPSDVRFISIKEYVLYQLTRQFIVDWSVASASGLFNVKTQQWDEAALSLLHITPAHLSEPVSPRFIFRGLDRQVARQIGVPTDTPLIIGGGDGPLASLGVGAFSPEVAAVNVGSSAAARLIVNEPWIDPDGKLYTQMADEDRWVVGGVVSSGGVVFEWFVNRFLAETTDLTPKERSEWEGMYIAADQWAAEVPPGAEGMLFIPYLGGEQCPGWNPDTRGAFWGLDFRHQRGHLVRAVLEGITFSIYRVLERIQDMLALQFDEVRVTGGLTSSTTWLQIAADVFGYPIAVPDTTEGSARGAAILALLALGVKSNLEDLTEQFRWKNRVLPRLDVHNLYRNHYERFLNLLTCAQ